MTSVHDIVHHYQKSIEKASNDEKRLLHCLNKLYRLPVTVQHLQETGIGRTVNSLRKFDGEVGSKAKALVTKWKEMVAAEESSDNEAEESEKSDDDNIHSDHEDLEEDDGTPNSSPDNRKPLQIVDVKLKQEPIETHQIRYNEDKSSHRKEIKHKEIINTDTHHEHNNDRDSNDNGYKSKHHQSSSTKISSSHSKSHSSSTSQMKSANGHEASSSSKDKPRDSEKHSHSSHKHEKSSSHHNSSSGSKRKRDDSLSDKVSDHEEIKLVIGDEKSRSSKKTKSDHKSSNHHHSSSSKHREHSKSKEHGSGSSSSSNHHKSKHEKSRRDNDEEHAKEKSSSSQQNGETSSSKHLRDVSPQADAKHNRSDKSSKEKKNKPIEIEPKTSELNKTPKKRVHESDEEKDFNGIDNTTGASFADALGMLEPTSSKKVTKKKIHQSPTQTKPEKSSYTAVATPSNSTKSTKSTSSKPSTSKPSASTSSTVPSSSSSTPSLLAPTVKLKPLDVDLFVPTISNNYKPMPLNPIVMDCVFYNNKPQKKFMTDEEALGASISSKTMRTKVYSGTKTTITTVPPLLELCIRVLQKNIDALEYTGGVPFDILKPILERASAEQLFNFEHYNPYLMDDSDVLWQGHCVRRFKSKKRLEMETWREMFIRCLEEQESKLASLTENIKKTQVQSVPVKQTKMAYIDSTAKAPRNIQRKQIQFGTERKLITTPAARVAALSNITSNIGQVGDSRLKVAAGSRDYAQVQGSSKPRKAPLMAKAMQLMKGRFKR